MFPRKEKRKRSPEQANPTFSSSSFLSPATEPTMVDRISNLPDELLCHILSFLPTKFAFTTTVLSKRWTPLFYSLPVLDFDVSTHPLMSTDQNVDQFCRFVDNIMLSPLSTNKPLKKFSLFVTQTKSSLFNFNTCLEAATRRRRVEELHISNLSSHSTLKPIIFISQTLVVVKLDDLRIGTDTSSVHLPSLKTLHLKYVYFTNQNDCINFLSACPNVDDLEVANIFHQKHDKNNAPKGQGFKSLTFSKLVKANIGRIYATINKLIRSSIHLSNAMFNGIHNVQFLRLTTVASFKVIPVFSNLIHIELVFFFRPSHCWDDVVELLRHCPKLQILFINKWSAGSSNEWKCPISVLECVSSHLNSCTILNFDGSANDLRFAKYILQNASLLQDMTFSISTNGMFSEENQIIEELSFCPRISPGCKISFRQFRF